MNFLLGGGEEGIMFQISQDTANHKEETSHNFSAFLCLEDGAIWGP